MISPLRLLLAAATLALALSARADVSAAPATLPVSDSQLTWTEETRGTVAPDEWLAIVGDRPAIAHPTRGVRVWPATGTETREIAPGPVAAFAAHDGELVVIGRDGRVIAYAIDRPDAPRDLPALPAAPSAGALLAAGPTLYFASAATGVVTLEPGATAWRALPSGGPAAAELDAAALALRWDDLAYREALLVFTPTAVWRHTAATGFGWTRLATTPAGFAPRSAAAVGPTHVFLRDASGRVLAFHVLTRTFVSVPTGTGALTALAGNGSGVWGVVDGQLRRGRIVSPTPSLGWIDWTVIIVYLGAMVWIGSWFSRDEKNASGYFLGGRQIPWWAAGLSIWATGVSAISFMAIPAKTYATNWHRIAEPMGNVIVLIGGAYLFIPLLRRLNLTTVMEHTELRFHPSLRLVATASMVLTQIGGRMATTLLLPAMALSATTGLSETTSILAMGIVTTIYTAMGGFKAVIWTDVVQTVLMLGGALLTFGIIVAQVPGGVGGVLEITREFDKFRPFDWTPDLTTATVYVFGLWTVGQLLGGVSQDFAQRAFSTPNVRAAQRSMITAAVVSIPGTLIFFGTGTALFAYYHTHAAQLPPLLANDNIVPLFVVQNVPAGVAGLIVAGIFAAAMSTLSGMNSVATVIVRDFYRFSGRTSDDAREVRLARIVTYACGALATGAALYMAQLSIASLWDNFSKTMAILGGGMAGVGALGMLTTRANTFGVYCSIVVGAVWVTYIATATRLHFAIYGLTTLVVCFITGYLASLLYTRARGLPPRNLTGLTIWTTRRGADE
jgi:SSS family transporter